MRLTERVNYACKICSILLVLLYTLFIQPVMNIHAYFSARGMPTHLEKLVYVLPGFLFSYLFYELCRFVLMPRLAFLVSRKILRENEDFEQKVHRLGNLLYSLLYYIIAFVVTYVITGQSDYKPRVFGGSMDLLQLVRQYLHPIPEPILVFYMMHLGHHIERLAVEVRDKRDQKTFSIMIFHHLLAITLVFGSFVLQVPKLGLPVMMLYDVTDIMLAVTRLFREMIEPFKAASRLLGFLLIGCWIYFRIYINIKEMLYPFFVILLKETPLWR